MSPMRICNNIPFEGIEAGLKFRPLVESQHIEFFEMIDPATMGDSCFI